MGRLGLMRPYIRPVYPGAKLCGTAVTVLLQPGDNWMLHVAAEQVQPGDVMVAACTTESEDGFFGDLLATSSRPAALQRPGDRRRLPRRRRPAGDGLPRVQPRHQLQGHRQGHPRFGQHSRGRAPNALVNPGDVVVADVDGVVVVPADTRGESLKPPASGRTMRRAKRAEVSPPANWAWTSTPCASRSPRPAWNTWRTDDGARRHERRLH